MYTSSQTCIIVSKYRLPSRRRRPFQLFVFFVLFLLNKREITVIYYIYYASSWEIFLYIKAWRKSRSSILHVSFKSCIRWIEPQRRENLLHLTICGLSVRDTRCFQTASAAARPFLSSPLCLHRLHTLTTPACAVDSHPCLAPF
jgi:hypothetical protein